MFNILEPFIFAFAIFFGGVSALVIMGLSMRTVKIDIVMFANQTYGVRKEQRTVIVAKYIVNKLSFGVLCNEEPTYEYLTKGDARGMQEWMSASIYSNDWREFSTKEEAELALYAVSKFGNKNVGVVV